jgi:tetratricopeptide (TPR) repeat protein
MAFATSYRELHEFERSVFRLLSLNPGPDISLPAAAALTGLPMADCRRRLDALVAAHLLEQRGALDRYAFHDLLKAFAESLAQAEETTAVRRETIRRMLDFYLHSAHRADRQVFAYRHGIPMPPVPNDVTPMRFDDERGALEWCRRERRSLMAAVDCATRLGFWSHAWQYPHVLAGNFKRLGLRAEVRHAQERGVAAARADGRAEAEGATLSDMGQLAMESGDVGEARKFFHLAKYIAEGERSVLGIATSQCHMARLDIIDGNIASGIDHYHEALRMATNGGHIHLQAVITTDLGDVFLSRKQYENAMAHYHSALHLYRAQQNLNGQMNALAKLSSAHVARRIGNDANVALEFASNSLRLRPAVIDVDVERRARMVYAEVLLSLGRRDDAVEQSGIAVALARQTRAVTEEAAALKLHASALKAAGRRAEALVALQLCAAIFQDRGDMHEWALVRNRLTELATSLDSVPAARDETEERTVPRAHPAGGGH